MHPLLSGDPTETLTRWYHEAEAMNEIMVDAMTLATVSEAGQPRARIVLFKGILEDKIAFFTNYESAKAREMAAEARVALTFHFRSLARQIRVEGYAVKLSAEASDAYFATRPRESQLGAWASPQSQALGSREELEQRSLDVGERFRGGPVPRPPFWGGYGVEPETFEFWIGADHRLHDRFLYGKAAAGWSVGRLAP